MCGYNFDWPDISNDRETDTIIEPVILDPSQSGLLIVVSGPSAVGKDTILDLLMAGPEQLRHPVRKCVTATTREPREGESDGVDYHFLSVVRFQQMAQQDGFLEYANVFGNWYGTPRQWVREQRAAGTDVILKIDVQGALAVQQAVDDALLIFFRPPSLDELERRLRGAEHRERGADCPASARCTQRTCTDSPLRLLRDQRRGRRRRDRLASDPEGGALPNRLDTLAGRVQTAGHDRYSLVWQL